MSSNDYIAGKKILLFQFDHNKDFSYFMELFKNGNRINLPEIAKYEDEKDILMALGALVASKKVLVLVAMRSFGNELKHEGMIFLIRDGEHKVNIINIADPYIMKGLSRKFKEKKFTYAEDILITAINHCFENEIIERVSISVPTKDKLKLTLLKKVGFKKEGVLRKYIKLDDEYYDITIMAKIREKANDESREEASTS